MKTKLFLILLLITSTLTISCSEETEVEQETIPVSKSILDKKWYTNSILNYTFKSDFSYEVRITESGLITEPDLNAWRWVNESDLIGYLLRSGEIQVYFQLKNVTDTQMEIWYNRDNSEVSGMMPGEVLTTVKP